MEDLFRSIYDGVTAKDWFLVAGAALSLVVMGARWALAKWWPSLKESDIKGVAITAVLAGLGALANAWLADKRVASTETLLGAVKVWAAAVFAYVTAKKVIAAKATEPAAS
jgi:hypothetical protein